MTDTHAHPLNLIKHMKLQAKASSKGKFKKVFEEERRKKIKKIDYLGGLFSQSIYTLKADFSRGKTIIGVGIRYDK